MDFNGKNLIVFDLDGTLTESKSPMDSEMSDLLTKLLARKKVAIISGGAFSQFEGQVLSILHVAGSMLHNLYLFPTTGTRFVRYKEGAWKEVYADMLSDMERAAIKKAFERVFDEVGYVHPEKVYGEIIEDRGTQVTFSALGQDIVKELGKAGVQQKEEWRDRNHALKMKIANRLAELLPAYAVSAAGYTSIDVTKKGIDKKYGIEQIEILLGIPKEQMLFVGDALFEGGNDYPVKAAGVECVAVKGPEETKKLLFSWL